jgi:Peptidase family C25/Propeptide_C25
MKKRFERSFGFMTLSKRIGLAALLMLTLTLVWTANAMSAEDFNHSPSAVPSSVSVERSVGQESTSEFHGDSGTTPEQSPLIKQLHQARETGDDATRREIEAMLEQPRVIGEDAGESATSSSNAFGGPGEPEGASAEMDAMFGTDIIVRNYDTMERNQSMASDSSGNLYVAFETDLSATGYYYIQIYWSSDGGDTWTAYGYVSSSNTHLTQPSIAIGQGTTDRLMVAYIVDDGTNIPHPEVAFSPLGVNSWTIVPISYVSGWHSYNSPVLWTDSYDWSGWFPYLTCEASFDGSANTNVSFWRSTDQGATFSSEYVVWGNTDTDNWQDPDGTYGTTLNRVFIACFNNTDKNLYALSSDDFGANWNPQVQVGVDAFAWEDPGHAVDPDIEAATGHDNVMVAFTRGYTSGTFSDCIGQTYSTDAGTTFPRSRYNVDGSDYAVNEFAPELTANEGGSSWHLAYTRSDWFVRYTSRPQDLSGYWSSTHDVVNDTNYASAAYPKKGIASNWATDIPGIAWSDYRPATGGDYDTYFDYDRETTSEPIIRIQPTSLTINQAGDSVADSGRGEFVPVVEGAKSAPQGEPMLGMIRSDESRLDVKLATTGMFVEEKAEGGDTYKTVRLGRYNGELPPGQPNLPAIRKHVYVPKGKSANFEVTLGNSVTFTNYLVYPTQLPQMDTKGAESPPFYRDEGVYGKDEWLPKDMVSLGPVEIVRGHAIRLLSICPFQYNPARKILRVFPEIDVQILFNGQEIDIDSHLRSPVFDQFVKGIVVNPGAFAEGEPGVEAYTGEDYLIITAPAFEAQANALAAHKIGRGISTGVVTTAVTGTTSSQIKAYIQNMYDTYAPTYVLLLGDVETIPTTYDGTANTGTDLYYSTVDGADYVADLFLGRISVDTVSEAQTVVDKIINYETSPPAFPPNAAVAAYFQDGTPYSGTPDGYEDRRFVRTSEEVRDFLMGEGYNIERIYCAESGATPTNYNNGTYGAGEALPAELLRANGFDWDGDAADISAAINSGVFLMMHRDHGMDRNDGYSHTGWGDPYYVETHIAALTNGELLPVVMSMNCQTGWFDGETDHHASYNYESFCELFLRKSGGGAVGVFGATRNSYSGHNDFMAEGIIDSVWPNFLPTVANSSGASAKMGPMLNHGKFAMDQLWGDPWGVKQLEHELFHVFGDPSLEMWTNGSGEGNTFTIYNDGTADLEITSMVKRDGDAWLSWTPTSPITIAPGGSRVITVSIDWGQVAGSSDDERIIVYSNDTDMSPYPSAVYITANKSAAGPGDELAVDFGSSGLYHYDDGSWAFLTGSNSEDMLAVDRDLYVDFGTSGLYKYDGTWTFLTGANTEDMVAVGTDLYVDFGTSGLYKYDGTWTWLTGSNSEDMVAVGTDLYVDFDTSGLFKYDGTWTWLTGANSEDMVAVGTDLYVDFGASGLYKYDGTWTFITGANAEDMVAVGTDLYVDFGASGLYKYDGTWTFLTGNSEDMVAVGTDLYVDFGTSGLYKYDGTWTFITGANAEDMVAVGMDLYVDFASSGLYKYDGAWTFITGANAEDMIAVDLND